MIVKKYTHFPDTVQCQLCAMADVVACKEPPLVLSLQRIAFCVLLCLICVSILHGPLTGLPLSQYVICL